jgi:hypothetical protein
MHRFQTKYFNPVKSFKNKTQIRSAVKQVYGSDELSGGVLMVEMYSWLVIWRYSGDILLCWK